MSHLNKHITASGFTLIELMITVGIFAFMTALILARYSSFNSGTLLADAAYDTALTIRQAQTYGTSVMTTDSTTVYFNYAYGVHFDTATPTQFVFFFDNSPSTPDHVYTNGSDGFVNKYNLKQGATIKYVCASNTTCIPSSPGVLDVTFKRPDPTAIIYSGGNQYTYAAILISSADGSNTHMIVVRQNGQVSVQ